MNFSAGVKFVTRDPVNNDRTPTATSTSLLMRAKADDQSAWEILVELYSPLIYKWCLQSGYQSSDAADIGQEVFQAVARGLHSFHHDKAGDTFRGWLRTITRNKIRDHARAKINQPVSIGGSDAYQHILQVPLEEHAKEVSEEKKILYDKAISLLRGEFSDLHWKAFEMTAINEHQPIDVAEKLGMTTNNVRLIKSRVLRRLREQFADVIGSDPL